MNRLALPAALGCLLLAQCQTHEPDPDPLSQLPPATQTGANTFGCLLNGQTWLPEGSIGGTSNFYIIYDPTYNGGNLDLRVYRLDGERRQRITLQKGNVLSPGEFLLSSSNNALTVYSTYASATTTPGPCNVYASSDADTYCKGKLTITRLDLQAGIIAGTFACTLWQPGCDTLKLTQGRFDRKL